MHEYKPNSHKSKGERRSAEPDKKVEKVIAGTAKVKKRTEVQKFVSMFVAEDVADVKSFIVLDVIIPTIKKAILDVLHMTLYGETGGSKRTSTQSRVSYGRYFDERSNDRRDSFSRTKSGYRYDDIVLDSRGEAEEVLSKMDELISSYGLASVADLYESVGITGNYTDNKYGWTDIRSASVIRDRDGYLLKLPKPLPLN